MQVKETDKSNLASFLLCGRVLLALCEKEKFSTVKMCLVGKQIKLSKKSKTQI